MSIRIKKQYIALACLLVVTVGLAVYWRLPHHTPSTSAESGVQGVVTYGPLCPVEPCSAKPSYDFDIIAFQNNKEIGKVRPDRNGHYELMLSPGTYELKASRSFASELGGPPRLVQIQEGKLTQADLSFDTGVR